MRASHLTLITFFCGFIAFALAGAAFVGDLTVSHYHYFAHWDFIAEAVPMAPNTAVMGMFLGIGLMSAAVRNRERDKVNGGKEALPLDKVGLLIIVFCSFGIAIGWASGAGVITISSGQIVVGVVLSYWKEIYSKAEKIVRK